jgi:galactose mutarotase-like enzyme
VFGPNLVLRRRIFARVGESSVRIEDEVENEGFEPEPLMVLYHINLGWPLLDNTSRLLGPGSPGESPEPRDAQAGTGLDTWDRFAAPTPGFRERVFYHRPAAGADGLAEARLENPALGLTFSVKFRPEELPEFVQWTMTGEGTYVLGLEPATCRVEGPAAEEAAGRLIRLKPGETRSHRLELEVSR